MALCTAATASKARLYTPLHSVLVPSIPFPASRGRLYGTPTRPPAHKTTGIMHVAHRPMKQPLRVTSEESSNDVILSLLAKSRERIFKEGKTGASPSEMEEEQEVEASCM
ncbi:hypothetical protein KI387_029400, partial [Taxus chinensis]